MNIRRTFHVLLWLALLALPWSGQPALSAGQQQAPDAVQQASSHSLTELLNPDGTLNLATGFNGSLNVANWSMQVSADGVPHFFESGQDINPESLQAPDASGDEFWDDQFGLGTSGDVYAVAVDGDNVYVGGDFDLAGNTAVQNIARWSDSSQKWSPLGDGVNGRVNAIAVGGDGIYVGGTFTQAGDQAVNAIARWDGDEWHSLGDGVVSDSVVNGVVNAVEVDGPSGNVYVGGMFSTAGDQVAANIARWDGDVWYSLGSGLSGGDSPQVYALALNDSDLYVGGSFNTAGGNPVSNIACWHASSETWSPLGNEDNNGTHGDVRAISIYGDSMYVGGGFNLVEDEEYVTTVDNIARWLLTEARWQRLSEDVRGVNDTVMALALDSEGTLFLGGSFTEDSGGGTQLFHISRWDGEALHTLPTTNLRPAYGMDGDVYALTISQREVYLGGAFLNVNEGQWKANRVVRWFIDDELWSSLGRGLNGSVNALAIHGSDVYVGGTFSSAGGVSSIAVVRWNSGERKWFGLDGGMDGRSGRFDDPEVYTIVVSGDDVYVGGDFATAGGEGVYSIARWDTLAESWHSVGDGIGCDGGGTPCSAYVRAIAVLGDNVIIGGRFDYVGDPRVDVENIAWWDGTAWHSMDGGVDFYVHAIVTLSLDQIYVGGSDVRFWNGDAWSDVGDNEAVSEIRAMTPGLYMGGDFTAGDSLDYIARLEGNAWQAVNGGLDSVVRSLHETNDALFAGGDFTVSDSHGVARWNKDSQTWHPLGSGTSDSVHVVAFDGNYVYVGGVFTTTGESNSYYFGRWGNLPPVAFDDAYNLSLPETVLNVSAEEGLLANDLDPDNDTLTVTLDTDVLTGTLDWSPDGSFNYTLPSIGYTGDITFTYHVNDAGIASNTAMVTIIVNTPPVAVNDSYRVPLNTPVFAVSLEEGVLRNDIDADNDDLSASLVADVFTGTLVLDDDGSFIYTLPLSYHGEITFAYQISDGFANSNVATVTITLPDDGLHVYLPLINR